MAKKRSGLVGVFILLAAVGSCVALMGEAPPKTEAQVAADRLEMAMIRCQNQTRGLLADPSGFDPQPFGQWQMVDAGEDRYAFTFRARARNGFGALVWADFACDAVFDGSYWTASIRQD